MKKIGIFIYCLLLIISPATGGRQVNGDMAPIGSSYGNTQQESVQHDERLSSEAQPIELEAEILKFRLAQNNIWMHQRSP